MINFRAQSESRHSFRGVKFYALQCCVVLACVTGLNMQVVGQIGPQSKRQPITLVPGDYLRSDYLATLRRTRSPKQSDVSGAPQLIEVSKIGTGISFTIIFNFHEGGAVYTVAKDGSVKEQDSAGADTSNVTATVIDEHHLRFGNATNPPQIYTFVGDAEGYAAEVALVGRYADDRGREYIFGEDGWATFPDQKFRYIIGIDHVLTPFDYFWVPPAPTKKEYAFRWVEGRLQLFEIHGEFPDEVIDKRPLVVLHAVSLK